jgi:hypothetical protein
MNGNLKDFLVNLASDPDLLARFAADPAGEVSRAGLSEEETAAVLSRDSRELRRALGASMADHMTQIFVAKASRKRAKRAKKAAPAKKRPAKAARKKASRKTGRKKR